MLQPDTDRALENREHDEFGFAGIARKLAPSLVAAASGDGMVIGIEGPWGSGKTTMLNLLREELPALDVTNLHIINIAPWLTGDSTSLVRTLIEAMAEVLDKLDEATTTSLDKGKDLAVKYGNVLREYASKTSRGVVPLVKLAGLLMPGATAVATGLELGTEFLDKFGKAPTEADVKRIISARLAALDIRFLVLIDDLDRLEPAQAVEVVRLVRSVADFPKVAYVMCYDRSVLANALQTGLGLTDGDLFLQKVVQLTFSIPLPEPFDLRMSLRQKALQVYEEVKGTPPSRDEADEIKLAIDREGNGLRTPRDVKLVLNGIKFIYASLSDQVYFPDICRINLVKILNPALYLWLEKYLSLRSVLVTGDARIDEDERTALGDELKRLLPSSDASSARSIWGLRRYIPSVRSAETSKDVVFSSESDTETSSMYALKRLGSPNHYRFYFALTGPKTVLTDAQFNELIALAENDLEGLRNKLIEYIYLPRPLGKSWFEYIIDQLDAARWQRLSAKQIQGVIIGVVDVLDEMLTTGDHARPSALGIGRIAESQIRDGIQQLRRIDDELLAATLQALWCHSPSISWLVGDLLRTELWHHGIVGDQPKPEHLHALKAEEIASAKGILETRLSDPATRKRLQDGPHLPSLLFGWLDMSGAEPPKSWVAEYIQEDANLVKFLLQMRSWSMSDRVYYPLRKKEVSRFVDWDQTMTRLDTIGAGDITGDMAADIAEIRQAIEYGKERGEP